MEEKNLKSYRSFLPIFLALALLATPLATFAQATQQEPKKEDAATPQEERRNADRLNPGTFAGLKLRGIGPAFTSGRIVAIAVDPTDKSRWYIGAASGGVWKTTNAGVTWTPIFDNEGSYSIGVVVVDQKNPLTLWVGTGENNSQRSVAYGDGVYRSDDGGKSWKNVGLKTSEHIGRIVIDPRNSDHVYVAAQGPLWGAGGDRGLYQTTDGGKTWNKILNISDNTGVTDVVLDHSNPDILYAASWQRRRHVFTLINGGPESAIYKSTDAGATWNKLRAGLPTVDMGRIGLAISPVDANVVYATIEAADNRSGIYRSTDKGGSWERRSPNVAQAMYYAQISVDPKNGDRVYLPNVVFQVSDDGGKTFHALGERNKHVDNHVIWVDPDDTRHYLVGCDGGLYESFDRGENWNFKANMPIPQFYDVTVDNDKPFYNIYGGTQDNYSFGGPSRTRSASGIVNADWYVTLGGDGFHSQVDPADPNTVYSALQYGVLVRFDKRTGERVSIQPLIGKDEAPLRYNWDTPFIISPHSHTRLYYAANKLYRSDDRGNSWKLVSGELSRNIDRNSLPVMGKIWGPDAVAKNQSTSLFGNSIALAESPKKEGLIYVGTDDGVINITEDSGKTWRRVEKFPGVPDMTYVSRILASQHDANTVYATFENHKNADFNAYILKSTDAGKSWTSLKGNLPAQPLYAIAEDHVNPQLLFVGTEFGLFFTLDGGQKWTQLKGNLPIIAVRDLAIQKRENDLVVATFGRGFYVLDDYSPLRLLKPEMLEQEAQLFPVKETLMYIESQPLGGRGKSFQGESFYTAPNPPFGATFTYYLKESYKTKKQLRQEAERRGVTTYPSQNELRAEDEEEAPTLLFTITDAQGNVVRHLSAPVAPGLNRLTWNLRYPAPILIPQLPNPDENPFFEPPTGGLVMPGIYTVKMMKRVGGVLTPLATAQEFTVTVDGLAQMNTADRAALVEFQRKVARLQRALTGALDVANTAKTRLGLMRRAVIEAPSADTKLLDEVAALDNRVNDLLRALRGDAAMAARNENAAPGINERVQAAAASLAFSIQPPTQTQMDQYNIAAQEFEQVLTKLRTLVETDMAKLEKALEAAGAPYTPGRFPEWKDR
ncbi:MAG: glycosyl hydrolase [Acidobacteria bacterium]|nr:glycosyl hydrolase [Acidobacteriota bacterium]